ncbi:MAG: hypothetical protein AAF556_00770, partial [Pseudomonadota bacterium]
MSQTSSPVTDLSTDEVEAEPAENTRMPGFVETGWLRITLLVLGALVSLIHIYFNTLTTLIDALPIPSTLLQNGIHFATFALLCVMVYLLSRGDLLQGRFR